MILQSCNRYEFVEQIGNKKIICFGAGTAIKPVINNEVIVDLSKHIACFIDNDKEKWDKYFQVNANKYPIFSPNYLDEVSADEYVILIACGAYVEVYSQLEQNKKIKEMHCYLLDEIIADSKIDINHFMKNEVTKDNFCNYRDILEGLNLKDKYKGKRCFIIGNGPSLKAQDLELLKDEVTFAGNKIYLLFNKTSWRPTFYCILDYYYIAAEYEKAREVEAEIRFLPREKAMAAGVIEDRFVYYNRQTNHLRANELQATNSCGDLKFSDDIIDVVYGGDTVTYDMLQIATYMGFKEIYLLGMDHTYNTNFKSMEDSKERHGNHFCDEYEEELDKMPNYQNATLDLATMAYKVAAKHLENKDTTIYNATRGGKLEIFERVNFDELIKKDM